MIGAIQAWIAAYAAGNPYARCRFRRVIETLLDTVMDESGKIVAAPGYHDEFLLLKGQSLRKFRPLRIDPNLARPVIPERLKDADDRVLERLMSDAVDGAVDGRFPRARQRPRS